MSDKGNCVVAGSDSIRTLEQGGTQSDDYVAKHPAAFINALSEEGSKEETIEWLQRTWDDLIESDAANSSLQGALSAAVECLRELIEADTEYENLRHTSVGDRVDEARDRAFTKKMEAIEFLATQGKK